MHVHKGKKKHEKVIEIVSSLPIRLCKCLFTIIVSYDRCIPSTRWNPGKCEHFV